MQLVSVYKCLCDLQRLRILNLLREGPLCVCHLVTLLDSEQFKVSKQLRYMKDLGMLESERRAQWVYYRIETKAHPVLLRNLQCLQDLQTEHPEFANDLRNRKALFASGSCGTATQAKVSSSKR